MIHGPIHTVLCIDDDPESTELRREMLESAGFRVLTANNGPDGLALVAGDRPDIVLLDYLMPGMDGGEVAGRIKALRPDLPIILLSAHLQVPAEALRWVDCYMVKGSPVEHLFGRIGASVPVVRDEIKAMAGRKAS
jgi:CheY-like chemotaxis protein